MTFQTKRRAPDREALKRKLDDIRDKKKSDPPLEADEVTGVINLALEELCEASERGARETTAALERMREAGQRVATSEHPPPVDD